MIVQSYSEPEKADFLGSFVFFMILTKTIEISCKI